MKVSLELLELLMHLYANKYMTSSKIRENYDQNYYNKLNYLLAELIKNKFIKKRRPKEIKPGGDKLEYMLIKPKGVNLRNDINEELIRILLINKDNRKKILKSLLMKDTNVIVDIVSEFSDILLALQEIKNPKTLQKKLYSVIKNHLF